MNREELREKLLQMKNKKDSFTKKDLDDMILIGETLLFDSEKDVDELKTILKFLHLMRENKNE